MTYSLYGDRYRHRWPAIDVVLEPVTAGPVVDVTVTPATHFCEYDRIQKGAASIALCGAWVEESDIQATPTCAACAADLARTAEDVFGTDEPFAALRPRAAKAGLADARADAISHRKGVA